MTLRQRFIVAVLHFVRVALDDAGNSTLDDWIRWTSVYADATTADVWCAIAAHYADVPSGNSTVQSG